MMSLLIIYGYGGIAIFAFVVGLWWVSVLLKRSDIIDAMWSVFFLLAGSVYAFFTHAHGEAWSARSVAVMVLLWAWGVRLAVYLAWRTAHKSEGLPLSQMARGKWLTMVVAQLVCRLFASSRDRVGAFCALLAGITRDCYPITRAGRIGGGGVVDRFCV
jgi:steroid 5-alpha reductase family enzyme